MELKINKIITPDEDMLNTITTWMYSWWGMAEGYSLEAIQCYVKHGFQESRLPQTYGMFLGDKLIGTYQFRMDDLFVRPDIYPWLANVYIDEPYRNKGYGKVLLESIKSNAKQYLDFDEIFLFTKHIGLYENYSWEFVSEIDTCLKGERIQRLYKLNLL